MIRILIALLLLWSTTFCSAQGVITTFRQIAAAAPSGGAPTFVQACDSGTWSGGGDGASCVLTSVAAGDVLLIGSYGPTGATVTVNGVALTSPLDTAKDGTIQTWIYPKTSAGNNPIVVQTNSAGNSRLFVSEFTGVGADPLDAHTMAACDSNCPYLGSISTANITLVGKDAVWTWCGADVAGAYAVVSDRPESSTSVAQDQGLGYAEGYRIQLASGNTYSQCDQLSSGFVAVIAIRGI